MQSAIIIICTNIAHWSTKLKQEAKDLLPKDVFDFIAGGAACESAIGRNLSAFKKITIIPKILNNVEKINTNTTLCGTNNDTPILIAPTAPHKLLHPKGEIETISAANKTNTVSIISFMASTRLEDIAQHATSPLWFQIQILKNRQVTERLIKRAENSGYKALVVTVDMPIVGNRTRDINNRFKIPEACLPVNLLEENLLQPYFESSSLTEKDPNLLFDASITWNGLEWSGMV